MSQHTRACFWDSYLLFCLLLCKHHSWYCYNLISILSAYRPPLFTAVKKISETFLLLVSFLYEFQSRFSSSSPHLWVYFMLDRLCFQTDLGSRDIFMMLCLPTQDHDIDFCCCSGVLWCPLVMVFFSFPNELAHILLALLVDNLSFKLPL